MSDGLWVAIISALGLVMSGVLVELVRARKRQDTVVHEVTPNSGGSLRDAVNRIASRVDSLHTKVDDHTERLVRVETRTENWASPNRRMTDG